MRPEWIAVLFFGGRLLHGALRGSLTDPGTWIGAIIALVVSYVVFAFLAGQSGDEGQGEPISRRERLHGFAAKYPWRTGIAGAAAMFAVWMALWPLFDRSPWPLAVGTSAVVFVVYVCAGHLYRKQRRGGTG